MKGRKDKKGKALSRDFARESKLGLYEKQKRQKRQGLIAGLRPREQAWMMGE